jgi:hypothetical protein
VLFYLGLAFCFSSGQGSKRYGTLASRRDSDLKKMYYTGEVWRSAEGGGEESPRGGGWGRGGEVGWGGGGGSIIDHLVGGCPNVGRKCRNAYTVYYIRTGKENMSRKFTQRKCLHLHIGIILFCLASLRSDAG